MTFAWSRKADSRMLSLVGEDGTIYAPSAAEVFDVEFDGISLISGHRVSRPSADIPSLTMQPSFAAIRLRLRLFDDRSIRLVLAVDSLVSAELDQWPESDQLIILDNWFPVDFVLLTEWREILEAQDIGLGLSLDARQVLWLLWASDLDIESALDAEDLRGFATPGASQPFDASLLHASLYPYQVAGSQFLSQMVDQGLGVLLADEMGLGKTMQALYVLTHTVRRTGWPNLVVAPSSTLANWEREVSRFSPSLSLYVHLGSRRTGDPNILRSFDLVLTSYDIVVRDRYLLEEIEWGVIVLDEAQAIKNAEAQRSQAVKALRRRAGIAVTGTPIENSLTDMWSIFEFAAPEYLGSLDDFSSMYPDKLDAAAALSRRVAPMIIRRTVASVASDLPPRVDINTPVYVSERLADLYEMVRNEEDRLPIVTLTRLRQVCAAPSALDEGWGTLAHDFPKYDRLIEIIDQVVADGSKALIFASYTEAIDRVKSGISARYPDVFTATIDGRSAAGERQKLIDDFTGVRGPAVLAMNPRAAGVGLNIQAASYVIHFTPEWNPAIMAQASARSHRRGQTKPVFVYYLYYVGTVEELMMSRLDAKRNLQDAGLSGVTVEPDTSDVLAALRLSPFEGTRT